MNFSVVILGFPSGWRVWIFRAVVIVPMWIVLFSMRTWAGLSFLVEMDASWIFRRFPSVSIVNVPGQGVRPRIWL